MAIRPFDTSRITRSDGLGQVNADGSLSLAPADDKTIDIVGNGDTVVSVDSTGLLSGLTPVGLGRKQTTYVPSVTDTTNTKGFNVNTTSFLETNHSPNYYDYVCEMGHGNTSGGGVDTDWGGFRDAWESRFWNGSSFQAERHIAAVRNPAFVLIGGSTEIRNFSASYNQDTDIARTVISGRQIQFLNDDPNHDGTQEEFAEFVDNGAGTLALQLVTCNFGIQHGSVLIEDGTVTVHGDVIATGGDFVGNQAIRVVKSYTVLTASDVDMTFGAGFMCLITDTVNGGTCVVIYENGIAPVILSQPAGQATTFVTGSPGANEIQIKNRATNTGIAGRAGSSRNNTALNVVEVIGR